MTVTLMLGVAFLPWLLPFALVFALVGLPSVILWTSIGTLAIEAFPKQRGAAISIFNAAKFAGWATAPVVLTPLYFSGGPTAPYLLAIAASASLLVPVFFYSRLARVEATIA